MTWKDAQERDKKKYHRGSRKQVWLASFYAALRGGASLILEKAPKSKHRNEAEELVRVARLIADAAVRAEFDS